MHTSVHMKNHVCFPPRGKTGRDHKGFVREKGDKKNCYKKKEVRFVGVFADERASPRPPSCMRPSAAEESLVRQSATGGVLRKGNGLCASVS